MYTLMKVGDGLRTFWNERADTAISRGYAVEAIITFLNKADKNLDQVHDYTVDDNPISDWEEIVNSSTPYWNYKYILKAYNLGIINGKDSTGRFDSASTLTRAELCQILYNAGLTQYTPADFMPHDYGTGYVSGG